MATLEELAFAAEREIGCINAFFPILPHLGNRWAATRPWEGRTIALNLHLTTLSAAIVKELALGGATCIVTAADPGTTAAGAVQLLRNSGVEVYTGGDMEDRFHQALSHHPDLLVDTGNALVKAAMAHPDLADLVVGAAELSRTGMVRLNEGPTPPFPVVDLDTTQLRRAVENRHGVGEGIWQAVAHLTGMHLSGRRAAIVGYGSVGVGLAAYARSAGMSVEVVEPDPVRRLLAHYDGFPTPTLSDALSRVQLLVTATGRKQAVHADQLGHARDGLVLLNAGHGGDEIDMGGIKDRAERVDHVTEGVVRYRLDAGHHVTILGGGHPLNIVLNSGSPEPVLLNFAVLGMVLEWLMDAKDLTGGATSVPDDLEAKAATLALAALGQEVGA